MPAIRRLLAQRHLAVLLCVAVLLLKLLVPTGYMIANDGGAITIVTCSGMTTEAEYSSWTRQQLQPYFDVVLSAFGAQRLMFGSDWPVCLVATEYSRWAQTVRDWTQSLSQTEQAAIMGENARCVYDLR